MWLLIKVDERINVGQNEERRILIGDDRYIEFNVIPALIHEAKAIEVHPATKGG